MKAIRSADGQFSSEIALLDHASSVNLTLNSDNTDAYLSSSLLIDTAYRVHLHDDFITTITSLRNGQNVSWYSAMEKLLQIPSADWNSLLSAYEQEVEMWMAAYSVDPEVNDVGSVVLTVSYRIPVTAFQEELVKLL